MSYVPPPRDIGFVIHELLDAPRVLARIADAPADSIRISLLAERRSSGDDRHAAKLTTARYYFAFLPPETTQNLRVIRSSGILVGDAALYQA